MDFTKEVMQKIFEMESIAKDKMNCSAEHWLEVACKLDYISINEKGTIVSLIRKMELHKQNIKLSKFCKKDYCNIKRMCGIMAKTTLFPICQTYL